MVLMGKYFMHTWYFWLSSVEVQFGVIRCISVFDDLVSLKRLVVERNGPNLGLRGKYLVYVEYF